MKSLLFIILMVVFSLTVFSREEGGVDVGNASQKGRISVPQFDTERELVSYVETESPKIESGRHPEVASFIRRGRCSSKDITFQYLEVEISYRWDRDLKKLIKEFSGAISVKLGHCLRGLR